LQYKAYTIPQKIKKIALEITQFPRGSELPFAVLIAGTRFAAVATPQHVSA
jgi:hypothetical protein